MHLSSIICKQQIKYLYFDHKSKNKKSSLHLLLIFYEFIVIPLFQHYSICILFYYLLTYLKKFIMYFTTFEIKQNT